MEYDITDFIGVFKNTFSKEYCESVIKLYEEIKKLGFTTNRQSHDKSLHINKQNEFAFFNNTHLKNDILFDQSESLVHTFVSKTWECYSTYLSKYGVLESLAPHQFYNSIKVQNTKLSEGYHVWHCEHASRITGARLLLVILYLNTVEDGGETEFLYQARRVKPEQGTLLICPSGFTHTHRGNPPLSNEKYIMNGWIEFNQ